MTTPRMDGTEAERLQWRVEALREGITDAMTCADYAAMLTILNNALIVDNNNAQRGTG